MEGEEESTSNPDPGEKSVSDIFDRSPEIGGDEAKNKEEAEGLWENSKFGEDSEEDNTKDVEEQKPETREDEETRKKKELESSYISSIFGDSASEDEEVGPEPFISAIQESSEESDYEEFAHETLKKLVQNKNLPKKRKQDAPSSDPPVRKRRKASEKSQISSSSEMEKKAPKKKNPKNRKTDEEIADIARGFLDKMRDAFEDDLRLIEKDRPAINKLKLLPEVEAYTTNAMYQKQLVEHDILIEFRRWLTPLPDKSLPNIHIREVLLQILALLNLEYITADILKDSGIGRMVHLYAIHPKETMKNKKLAEGTYDKWYRSLVCRKDRYDDMDPSMHEQSTQRRRAEAPKAKTSKNVGSFDQKLEEDEDEMYRHHARIPQPSTTDFGNIRPATASISSQNKIEINNSAAVVKRLTQRIRNTTSRR